jgi:hypothetical protein
MAANLPSAAAARYHIDVELDGNPADGSVEAPLAKVLKEIGKPARIVSPAIRELQTRPISWAI